MHEPHTGATFVDTILGSGIPYITYAVPFFFFLILLEVVFAAVARRRLYQSSDSFSDLACGILDQMTKVFFEGIVLLAYVAIYNHARLFDVTAWSPIAKWIAFVLLFLGVDVCFYWHHRFCHEWALGWAAHAVHHQSEEFNLVVALRQSALEHHLVFFFYLPLAFFGFPVTWFVAMFAFNLIWQFWCHTRLVGKLGPLEWIFNTPSHHRVHHGRNPKYLDKNYAGTLIVWDRLFGTFQEEEEEPVYGVTKPLRSWNPLWANLHVWWELGKTAYEAPYWWDKIRIWFMPLGWTPRGLEPKPDPPEVSADTVAKYRTAVPRSLVVYAALHFLLTLLISLGVLPYAEEMNSFELLQLWDLVVLVVVSLLCIGGIFELKRWVPPLEQFRLLLLVWVMVERSRELSAGNWLAATTVLLAVSSSVWMIVHRKAFTYGHGESPAPPADVFGRKLASIP